MQYHEMLGYTRAVSAQRLAKHVPAKYTTEIFPRYQILNNATVGLQQWKRYVFYVVRAEVLYAGKCYCLDQFCMGVCEERT
jgi:hypothetical protein